MFIQKVIFPVLIESISDSPSKACQSPIPSGIFSKLYLGVFTIGQLIIDGLIYKGFIDIYFMSVLICIFELGQVRALWCTPLYFNHPSTISTYQIGDSGIHKYQFIHLNRRHADAQPLWTVKKLE